jgi:hypothetical protein
MRWLEYLLLRVLLWLAVQLLIFGVILGGRFDVPDRREEF